MVHTHGVRGSNPFLATNEGLNDFSPFFKHRNGSVKLMYKYERIIYWSETDRCFLAVVPELPGCMADGETAQQA